MTPLRCIVLLQFTATFALGQIAQSSGPPRVPAKPEAVVRSLYHLVVARHPIGLPTGADRKAIAPYLSKGLIRRLDTALACETDYGRQHQDPNIKSQIAWFEDGFFSGGNERALPAAYHVASAQPEKDRSFRVHVRLTYRDTWATYGRPPTEANAFQWYVDVIVARGNGLFVVDDVIYLKDEDDPQGVEPPLSQTLTLGCDGSRWVGYGEQQNDSK